MSELKACPFCGCIPSLKQYDDEGLIGLVCPVGSACRDTGLAMAFIHEQKDTAIAAWNTRASDAELAKLRAENAELRKAGQHSQAYHEYMALQLRREAGERAGNSDGEDAMLDRMDVLWKEMCIRERELTHRPHHIICGPKRTCPDGSEHDYSDSEEGKTPEGGGWYSAKCAKCGHIAMDDMYWMD